MDGRKHRQRVTVLWVVLAVVGACGVAMFLTFHDGLDSPTVAAASRASTAQPSLSPTLASGTPGSGQSQVPPISHGSIVAMRDTGTLVEVVRADTPVTLREARASAASQFAFIGDSPVVEASKARVTVSDYGPRTTSEGRGSGTVQPIIQDRLSWVLVYDDVQVPIFGPITNERGPNSYKARFFVCVDAETGDFLSAESL